MDDLPGTRVFVERLFGASLACYPRAYRVRFGAEMAQVFSDLCQEVYRQGGAVALFGLWLAATTDLMKTALEMRFKELAHMTREHWIRLAGWALMIGSVTFAVGTFLNSFETLYWDELGGFDALYEYGGLVGFMGGPLLFGIGMFGLAARYGPAAGPIGRLSLLLGGLAGLVGLIGAIMMALQAGDGWNIWATGFALLFVGLLVFGLASLRRETLERWRAAPILASLPVVALFGLIPYQSLLGQTLEPNRYMTVAVILIVAVNMFLLGRLLQRAPTRGAALVG